MSKSILLGAVGGLCGVLGFASVGGFGPVAEDPDAAYSAHMKGCLRQLREVVPDEEAAVGACECMYGEFDKRGLSLLDAFGGNFEEMSMITRECAAQHGAVLD